MNEGERYHFVMVRRAPALLVLVGLVATGLVVFLGLREGPDDGTMFPDERLEPLVESPRPPVQAEPYRTTLQGRPSPGRKPVVEGERAALVRERNDLAREHRRVVVAYEAGVVSIQDVEEAEMRLLDARHRLGEIDGPTWHRGRAVLVARAVERTSLAVEAGVVPPADLERVRLALELERMFSGDADEYETRRGAFLAATKDRHRSLVEAGRASAKSLQEEYERLEEEFPPTDVAKARDR